MLGALLQKAWPAVDPEDLIENLKEQCEEEAIMVAAPELGTLSALGAGVGGESDGEFGWDGLAAPITPPIQDEATELIGSLGVLAPTLGQTANALLLLSIHT